MLVIERIENDIVLVEDGDRHFRLTSDEISGSFREGDVLVRTEHGYRTDSEATKAARERIVRLQNSLWE